MFLEKYTFTCCFTGPAFLPEFKGSTLRGGFGLALKKISCALKQQRCDSCLLFATCAYAFVFEMDKSARRPHPYVIIPPDIQQRSFKKNDRFTFEIILFGKANNYLPHIVYAVREMGRNGLGKGHEDQGQFAVKTISQGDKIIFAGEQLETGSPLQHLELSESSAFLDNRLTISFLTPLRLKYCNELRDSLPFHLLIRAALRRISSLEAAYG
ncbi:hypothetical protein ACOHYD_10155 [Desulfobacterota bacterium M19]